MHYSRPLVRGTLIRRYKRFLADVRLDVGTEITASCPNTGAMLGLTAPDSIVYLSEHDGAQRRYRHCLELVEATAGAGRTLVGINTQAPNRIVPAAVATGRIRHLTGYATQQREVKYGVNSRIDLLLRGPDRADCYVEVKNVTLSRTAGLAEFPDTVTARGAKHLAALGNMAEHGARAVMLFLVQRADTGRLAFAADLDPAYAAAAREAVARGVEFVAYGCTVTPERIEIDREVAIAW